MTDIHVNIKRLIIKYIIQQEIAEKIRVSKTTFNSWMNKKVEIKAEQVPELSKILKVSISELYGKKALPAKVLELSSKEQLEEKRIENKRLLLENETLKTKTPSKVKYDQVAER